MNKQLITVTPHSLYARFGAKHTITWILILTPGCIGIIFPVTRMREEGTREQKSPARGTTAVDSRARAEPQSPSTKQVLLTISCEEKGRAGKVSPSAQVQGHQQQHSGQGVSSYPRLTLGFPSLACLLAALCRLCSHPSTAGLGVPDTSPT